MLLSLDCTGPANAYKINDNTLSQGKRYTTAIKSLERQHDIHIINYVIYLSLKSEELQQGVQQVVLHRACLCRCGRLTANKILKLLCIHSDKVCKCSGALHFHFLHQSMKCAELLAPRLLVSSSSFFSSSSICCSKANVPSKIACSFSLLLLHQSAIVVNKHVCVCNGLRLIKQLSDSIVSLRLRVSRTRTSDSYVVRVTRTSDSYEALVRVASPLEKYDKVTELSR